MSALTIGATGMLAQQLNVETISNNIANAGTTGFKRQRAEFQDLMYKNAPRSGPNVSATGTSVPTGVQIGGGVRIDGIARVMEQGSLTVTNNKLDLMIDGAGYFPVQMPDGETAYTRAGNFKLDPDGNLVTADGHPVQPAITIPAGAADVAVNSSGEVLVKLDGQSEPQNVGRIQLATFPNDGGLAAIGGNLFQVTPAAGEAVLGNPAATGFGRVLQGTLETSNVNIVQEITALISAQRAYEMNAKVISIDSEMSQPQSR